MKHELADRTVFSSLFRFVGHISGDLYPRLAQAEGSGARAFSLGVLAEASWILGYIDSTSPGIVGQFADTIPSNWSDMFREFGQARETREHIRLEDDQRKHTFDLNLTPLYDSRSRLTGRLFVLRNITELKRAEEEKTQLISQLQEALEKIKTLKGLVPICANCKKIRDDKGYWNVLENYIESHSEASFSHGICPDCAKKLCGKTKWYQKMKDELDKE
ncbi:MAG: hypothetical protein GY866_07155 [Proteobacteria bacterium]|nr:hypothetical protein [Pseudomonadota bacterium]